LPNLALPYDSSIGQSQVEFNQIGGLGGEGMVPQIRINLLTQSLRQELKLHYL
jgi:hypothetical protein